MLREYRRWHSPSLNREMELLVVGHDGAPVLVFPTSMGKFYEWEDRGMLELLRGQVEQGWLQFYCVDSVDAESWYCRGAHPGGRADPLVESARELSRVLWGKSIGNALREWDGWAHDWDYWRRMLTLYINGHD